MDNDKIVTISFKVWANDDSEAEILNQELGLFVDNQGKQGRKVTAIKLTEAIQKWSNSPFIKEILNSYFSN